MPTLIAPAAWAIVCCGIAGLQGCVGISGLAASAGLQALEEQGAAAFRRSDFAGAAAAWTNGLLTASRAGNDIGQARFLARLCSVDEVKGQYHDGIERARTALALAPPSADPVATARGHNCLSLIHRRLGEYGDAASHAEAARAPSVSIGDPALLAESLRNLGAARKETGRTQEALDLLEQSLRAARTSGDAFETARTLNDLALWHQSRALYAKSLQLHNEALALRERIGDTRGRARILGNLCSTYRYLADAEHALDTCRQGLDLARSLNDRPTEAALLNNLAVFYQSTNRPREAIDAWQQAIVIRRGLGDAAGIATVLNNVGRVRSLLADDAGALDALHQALSIRESRNDSLGISSTQLNLGIHYLTRDQVAEALPHLMTALATQSVHAQPEMQWRIFHQLGRAYKRLGRVELSIWFGKQAVAEIQRVRSALTDMDDEVQRAFVREKTDAYRQLAGSLIDAGRLFEAQQILDMLKEEEQFDYIRRDAGADTRTLAPSLDRAESELTADYLARSKDIATRGALLDAFAKAGPLSVEDRARKAALEAELRQLQKDFDQYRNRLEDFFVATRDRDRIVTFNDKDLASLFLMRDTLKQLGHQTVLIHYLLLDDSVRIIVTGPDPRLPPVHRESRIGRVEINRLINDFLVRLKAAGGDLRRESKALHDALIAPIQADLDGFAAQTLMVSLDGTLRYLPFAALHDGNRYLIERYAVTVYTLRTKDRLTTRSARDWRVAGLGVTLAAETFPALPEVARELAGIIRESEGDADGVLPGKLFLDGDFTLDHLREVLSERTATGAKAYPVIHLASHFKLASNDANSFLLLGGGARVTVADLGGDNFSGTELLTLSACQTAVGTVTDADGREVEGFAYVAQMHGASAVMATLWSVADRSTAQLMVGFYKALSDKNTPRTKAEALRLAQLALLHGVTAEAGAGSEARGDVNRALPRPVARDYSHPYFWAPFILMGNWL